MLGSPLRTHADQPALQELDGAAQNKKENWWRESEGVATQARVVVSTGTRRNLIFIVRGYLRPVQCGLLSVPKTPSATKEASQRGEAHSHLDQAATSPQLVWTQSSRLPVRLLAPLWWPMSVGKCPPRNLIFILRNIHQPHPFPLAPHPLSHVLDGDNHVGIFHVNAVVGARRLCIHLKGGRRVPAAATGLDRHRLECGVRLRVAWCTLVE